MKNKLLKYYSIVFYLCSSFVAFADPGNNDADGSLETNDGATAPIDDYLWFLLIIGLVYAYYAVWKIQNQKVVIVNKI